MKRYFTDVPGLKRISLTNHALEKARNQNITEEMIFRALYHPISQDRFDTENVIKRQGAGITLVCGRKKRRNGNKDFRVITLFRTEKKIDNQAPFC